MSESTNDKQQSQTDGQGFQFDKAVEAFFLRFIIIAGSIGGLGGGDLYSGHFEGHHHSLDVAGCAHGGHLQPGTAGSQSL